MKCSNPNCTETDHEPTAKYCHACGSPMVNDTNSGNEGEEKPQPSALFRIRRNGQYGFVNQQGSVVVNPQYSDAHDYSEGLAAVKIDGRWGFIDSSSRWIIPPQFEEVHDFSESMAAVKLHGWGYVNTEGQIVIPCQYQNARDFSEGLAAVSKNGFWGYIDATDNRIIELQFKEAYSFKEGLARVRAPQEVLYYGFINKNGKFVIKPTFEYAREFCEGKSLVREKYESFYKYINTKGKEILICQWRYSDDFHEDLACVMVNNNNNDELGFIDSTGNMVLQARYDDAKGFSEGLAPVRIGALWGYIDKRGRRVIEPAFREAGAFKGGTAIVHNGQRYDAIDTTGKTIISDIYGSIPSNPKEIFDSASANLGVNWIKQRKAKKKRILHHLLLALLAIIFSIVEFCTFDYFHGWGWAFVPCVFNVGYTIYRIAFVEDECGSDFRNYEYITSFVTMVVMNVLAFIFNNGWSFLAAGGPFWLSIGIDSEIHD